MYLNRIFELSLTVDSEDFQSILHDLGLSCDEDDIWDCRREKEGVVVRFRNSQYKKRVVLQINTALFEPSVSDTDRLIKKLKRFLDKYFDDRFQIEDFTLSSFSLGYDIDLQSRSLVSTYLKVLRRAGKVKGFTPTEPELFDDVDSFCLKGNSNAVEVFFYNLEDAIPRSMAKDSVKGILRTEVRLKKPKAVRLFTNAYSTEEQIEDLNRNGVAIYRKVLGSIVPQGDFYKKADAAEIVRREVGDVRLRRKMLRLLALIPEKRSLWYAQREMGSRSMDEIMAKFEELNLSPVTISKRHNVSFLKSLYNYIK